MLIKKNVYLLLEKVAFVSKVFPTKRQYILAANKDTNQFSANKRTSQDRGKKTKPDCYVVVFSHSLQMVLDTEICSVLL